MLLSKKYYRAYYYPSFQKSHGSLSRLVSRGEGTPSVRLDLKRLKGKSALCLHSTNCPSSTSQLHGCQFPQHTRAPLLTIKGSSRSCRVWALSMPQFPHPGSRGNNSLYPTGLLGGLNEGIYSISALARYPAYRKSPINGICHASCCRS